MQAAHKAASVRFRPILMSSLAYAVGALPMLWATGAGAINQQYLGTAVFGGMVATALLTVLYAPFSIRCSWGFPANWAANGRPNRSKPEAGASPGRLPPAPGEGAFPVLRKVRAALRKGNAHPA